MRDVAVATGDEIDLILDKLEPILSACDNPQHAMIACLTATVIMMYPDCTGDDVFDGVELMSHELCNMLAERYPQLAVVDSPIATAIPKEKMN